MELQINNVHQEIFKKDESVDGNDLDPNIEMVGGLCTLLTCLNVIMKLNIFWCSFHVDEEELAGDQAEEEEKSQLSSQICVVEVNVLTGYANLAKSCHRSLILKNSVY